MDENFLKNRTMENKMSYKNYRMLFEPVKQMSKKCCFYSKQLIPFH